MVNAEVQKKRKEGEQVEMAEPEEETNARIQQLELQILNVNKKLKKEDNGNSPGRSTGLQ